MAGENNATLDSIQNGGIPVIQFGITPSRVTTYPTDPTMRNEGQPADAYACGVRFGNVEGSVSDLNTELGSHGTRITALETGKIPKTDIETTLETTGKVADSKATGDAIAAAEARITGMIDTTLAVQGRIAEAKATGQAIATAKTEAIASAQTGVVFSVETILPDTNHNVSLAERMATVAQVNTMIDQVLAGQ